MSQLAEEAVFPVTQRALPARAPSHGTVLEVFYEDACDGLVAGSIRVSQIVFGTKSAGGASRRFGGQEVGKERAKLGKYNLYFLASSAD